jgi:4-hydroxy-tetrahydrodipicolinate synthase
MMQLPLKGIIPPVITPVTLLPKKVMNLYNTIYKFSKHPARITLGTKCALSFMGICNDYMAPPLTRLNAEEREQIEKFVINIKETLE